MQAEIQVKFNEIVHAINILKKHFNWEDSISRIKEFNRLVEIQNFWDDAIKAQTIMREKKQLEKTIDQIKFIEIEKQNLFELMQLAEEEKDSILEAFKPGQLPNLSYDKKLIDLKKSNKFLKTLSPLY